MKNWEIFYKIYNYKNNVKLFDIVDKCFCDEKIDIDTFINELVQRSNELYVPNFKPYEEIEKKWLLTDFGKENFDIWYEEGKKNPGDSIFMLYSYLSKDPEVRLRKVVIDTTDKNFNANKITYFVDVKKTTGDKIKRITTHEYINKTQYNKLFKKSLGTCEKWFIPYYKNMYQLSKVKTKNRPILYTAEIEFDNLTEARNFNFDKEICLREVTDDKNFSTCNYVLKGEYNK